jgi:hypothetical protein
MQNRSLSLLVSDVSPSMLISAPEQVVLRSGTRRSSGTRRRQRHELGARSFQF